MIANHRYFINNLIDYDEKEEPIDEIDSVNTEEILLTDVESPPGEEITKENSVEENDVQQQSTNESETKQNADEVIIEEQQPEPKVEEPEVVIDTVEIKDRIKRLLDLIEHKQSFRPTIDDCDGGPYVGISGIAYMYWYLAQKDELYTEDERKIFLINGLKFLLPSLEYAEAIDNTSHERIVKVAYLLGNAGTYLIATLYYNTLNEIKRRDYYLQKYRRLSNVILVEKYLSKGSDDFLVGRSGYICGYMFILKSLANEHMKTNNEETTNLEGTKTKETNTTNDETESTEKKTNKLNTLNDEEVIKKLALITIESGRNYSNKHGYTSNCPLMYSYYETEYIGAAHGLVGIMQVLLELPYLLTNESTLYDIKKTIDFVLSLQTVNGNFPCAMDEIENNFKSILSTNKASASRIITKRSEHDELLHWCHGAPGVIWLFAKAYLLWKDDKYLQSCYKCVDLIWKRGLLRKGRGICHGVSGNAYAFLLMYKLTGEKKHLYRANKFQEFMFTRTFSDNCRIPDAPYSLFEGVAGTICFLSDLLTPEKTKFPLYVDIFG